MAKGGHSKSKRVKGFTQQKFPSSVFSQNLCERRVSKSLGGVEILHHSFHRSRYKKEEGQNPTHTPMLKQPSEVSSISLLLEFMQEKSLQS